jgi:glycosyltransferase involved in cell wall biosynthesis
MRILAITNMYPSEEFPGRGVFVHEQIKGLLSIGLGVRVLFVDRRREGAAVYYRMADKLANLIAGFDPDVLHVMYGGVMAQRVVRCCHVRPTVVTFHGSDLLGENLSGWRRKLISRYGVWCSRRAAKAVDGLVVVARHLLRALPPNLPREKVQIVPCGIDLERFKPMDTAVCRRKLGWDNSRFHVLFASSNGDPVKRPWLAQAAVEQAARRGLPAELHFMTDVPNSQVPTWLNASDVLLLTSVHEGSPTVIKEALACGLPIVSVDVGDVAERIEGVGGCFLSSADPAALAQSLSLVAQRRKRLECRDRVGDLCSVQTARRLKAFYEQVAGAPRWNRGAMPARRPAPAFRLPDGARPEEPIGIVAADARRL